MKKTLLIAIFAFCSQLNAQTVLFEDSFETYNDFIIENIGDWITIDIDGSSTYAGGSEVEWPNRFLPQAFQIFNPTTAQVTNATTGNELRNFDPRTGNKFIGSWAAVMPGAGEGGAGPNNDWLVSPPISLGASQNNISFWVKSMSSSYGLDTYRVGVFVGSGIPSSPADFTIISGASNLVAPFPNWAEYTTNLDNYSNQTIRVAIHCNSVDRYFFMVDDFKVTTATLSTDAFFASNFSLYPNPTTDVINVKSEASNIQNVKITDINGRIIISTNYNAVSNATLDVSSLISGMYLINISNDNGTGTSKFIKK
jgi:hypothetical protein